ncbi:histone deacetylase [Candidatus Bathyarchaeota archaeon]|nr:histone deacetylase [Candidatus Bathyarchaeota archaeon]
MKQTALIFSPKYFCHKTGPRHPEIPSRLKVIIRELNKSGILGHKNCSIVDPRNVSLNYLKLVHKKFYIEQIKRFCVCGGGLIDKEDTVVSLDSYEVALLAAGGALKAADLVMNGKYSNAFALVRPPGHHAGPDYPMGFCLFNNVAVAASYIQKKFGLNRILILDIDAHHGNGTQDIFWNSKNVLYLSLHEDPIEFPLTGFIGEVGKDEGLGYSVNIPFPYGTDDRIYLKAFNEIAIPIINQYKPQFILISTGFDNHYSDPIGNLKLSKYSYFKIFDAILEIADNYCQGKLLAVLEGGYSLKYLGKLACLVTAKMANISYSFKDKPCFAEPKVRKKAEILFEQIKRIQSKFWKL